MSLIVLGSAKSSPGVTTACLALCTVWPEDRVAQLVEADPDGGTLAARLGLASEPGLSTLAISGRRSTGAVDLADHAQTPDGGAVSVVVAPPSAEQVQRSLKLFGNRLPSVLRTPMTDVIVDAGRLRPRTPAWPAVEASDAILFIARPRLEELQQLPARLRAARTARARIALLLVGDQPYPPSEVASALDVDIVGVLADDPRGAAGLNRQDGARFARSPLLRSARDVAEVIVGWVREPTHGPRPGPQETVDLSVQVAG